MRYLVNNANTPPQPKGPARDWKQDGPYELDGGYVFGSSHWGTFQSVFADGSVHALAYTIDLNIFKMLGNINNRNPIPYGDW